MFLQILLHIADKNMLDAIVACIDDTQSLRHRIDPAVMVDISGDEHLCACGDGILYRAFSGTGADNAGC